MVQRVVIYGWAIPKDRVRGKGSGTLVDLVYYVSDDVSVSEVLSLIHRLDMDFQPMRNKAGEVVQDKVQIYDISVGVERFVVPGRR